MKPEEALLIVREAIIADHATALVHAQLVKMKDGEELLVKAAGVGAPGHAWILAAPTAAGAARALTWLRRYLQDLAAAASPPARWAS